MPGLYQCTRVREVSWHEGDVVRKLRVSAGLTLEGLAELAEVSFTTIGAMEIGKTKEPKQGTIRKLASAFGLTERELRDMVPKQTVRLAQAEPEKKKTEERASVKASKGQKRAVQR